MLECSLPRLSSHINEALVHPSPALNPQSPQQGSQVTPRTPPHPGQLKPLNKHSSSPPESTEQHQAGIEVICTSVIGLRQQSVNALGCG